MAAASDDQEAPEANDGPDRPALVRDILVFQFKLVVDGLRDFILVPISLVVGLISLLRAGDRPGTEFYDLLRYGRQTDRVINLFGAAEKLHGPSDGDATLPDIDEFVGRVEDFVVEEYRAGNMTAQAKEHLDRMLQALARKSK